MSPPMRARPAIMPPLRFVPQSEPRGYGHAIHCARDFSAATLPSHGRRPPLRQPHRETLRATPRRTRRAQDCAVSAVQATRESLLAALRSRRRPRVAGSDLYRVETVIEKPTPTEAEQRLMVPGVRAGYYLCFFGIHVLTPTVMEILGAAASASPPLSPNSPARSNTSRLRTLAAATISASATVC